MFYHEGILPLVTCKVMISPRKIKEKALKMAKKVHFNGF